MVVSDVFDNENPQIIDQENTPDDTSFNKHMDTALQQGTCASDIAEIDEVLSQSEHFFDEDDEEEATPTKKSKKSNRKKAVNTRQKWSIAEEEELKTVFAKYFQSKMRPSPNVCKKMIELSHAQKGLICKRSVETLKKKMFRLIDALN